MAADGTTGAPDAHQTPTLGPSTPETALTPAQLRTIHSLLPPVGRAAAPPSGSAVATDRGLAGRLRGWIESEAWAHAPVPPAPPLRLAKERLSRLERCPGLFQADLAGERPPFIHSPRSAAGTLLHRALEIEAGASEFVGAGALLDLAVERLARDRAFGPFWRARTPAQRAEVRTQAARALELFRESFPSLPGFRRRLAPTAELWLDARFAGGRLQLCGRVDLMVGRAGRGGSGAGGSPSRVLIDLKTGSAWPEHAEDMRFYALLFTLRCGVPPARVATLFLRSGECQVEEVSVEALEHATRRVVRAVRAAADMAQAGPDPVLSPGPHCAWCPRSATCPRSAVRPNPSHVGAPDEDL
jgi:hypothetical protein